MGLTVKPLEEPTTSQHVKQILNKNKYSSSILGNMRTHVQWNATG